MTIKRAFGTVACSALFCTIVGCGAGAALGYIAPDYYRTVLHVKPEIEFDPVQVGIGFGLNAGVFTGLVVGVLLVAIVAFFELKVRLAEIREGGLRADFADET